jgi:RNA polymerase sigma-70 factor (ECF subfamily)
VLREETTELLREAVLRIPPKYRLVLVHHDMEELETAEVAKIVGLSENNVRVRLHRARLFVRKELAKGRVPGVGGNAGASRKNTNCREVFANLSEYIDRRIDDVTCKRMAKHLDDCVPCKAFVKDLERAVQRCQQYEVSGSARISERVHNLLKQEYLRLLAQSETRS